MVRVTVTDEAGTVYAVKMVEGEDLEWLGPFEYSLQSDGDAVVFVAGGKAWIAEGDQVDYLPEEVREAIDW